MKKIDSLIRKIIVIIFTLISAVILYINLFKESLKYSCKIHFLHNNIALLLISLTMLLLVFLFFKRKRYRLISILNKKSFIIIASLFCLIQIFLCINIFFTTGWDAGILISNARKIAFNNSQGLNNAYFSKYTNNIFITGLFSQFFRLANSLGITDNIEQMKLLMVLQCILSSICGYIIFLTVKDFTNSSKYAFLSWLFYVVLIGTSPWMVIPYSDSIGLVFPIAIFRLFYLMQNHKHTYLKLSCIVLLSYLGFKIKPQIFIIFIAIALTEFAHIIANIHGANFKKILKLCSLITAIFIASSFLTNTFTSSLGFNLDKNKEFGITHFAMMGLNKGTDGVWAADDVSYSAGFKNCQLRKEGNIQEIKKRLSDYGFDGFINHCVRKSLINFNDGTFCFGGEGTFYASISKDRIKSLSPQLKKLFLTSGKYYKYSALIRQAAWILLLFLVLGICIPNKKDNVLSSDTSVLCLSLIGIITFEMIFEPRARYIYIYVPLYIICGTLGFRNIVNLIFKRKH